MYEWQNLAEMFMAGVERRGAGPFLWAKMDGAYVSKSWTEAADEVSKLARGLRKLGVGPGDRVVLCSESRPEWPLAIIAIMAIGGIAVPAYTTNTVADHLHILADSGAVGAITSSTALSERVLAASQTHNIKFLITMDKFETAQSPGTDLYDWDGLLSAGAKEPDDIAAAIAERKIDDTAALIYTSGTGGAPKGVMLSHKAIMHNCEGARDALEEIGLDDEVFLSFLPLSHSYEFMAGMFFPISIAAQIYYAEGIEYLSRNLTEARPTIMTAVPRLYEVMHGRIAKGVEQAGGAKQKLFNAAVELGSREFLEPGSLGFGEKIKNALVDKLVRNKVRNNFGGRLKALVSGGAPLNYEIGLFFTALGLRLLQGYGQTESAPLISVNRPKRIKLKTVGPPVKNTEVRIADDGEILARGDQVMQGYWRNQDATNKAIIDGWLHTGDVGHMDEDGYIEITDRKKDIIVNSGGDNLSPQRVEGFLTLQPEISQAMVHGDKRPHLVGIIVPDAEFASEWAKENSKPEELAELIGDSEFARAIDGAVDRVNADLAVNERVRRVMLIADAFSTDNEMMTPSLKVRRYKVMETYGERLEALY
ncbi:MAG: long-chain fatty acid--CoA ligase [Rhodospirillales bacterium]|jgi:long-chain acyl-CoA synthetase|nr:long-chain fatty acid--CoA ligase [Rhodospirillaceae bacterium]MDP6428063.1 long-chain fatty acid--CoA ligase [Rhodospirillales bacterium]MDP6644215.1 long-chain fatty acid--CoA ligase [Rhodospirillales bacterium]